jgi:DNA invertase Pin-like site-specific DNA recombinase
MRYSSEKQTEQSIEGQQRICTTFCEQQGYNIVGMYIDRATSAFKDTDKRTQFQKMIKDSDKHLWDAVVVYKLDRFARNRYDAATYKAKLKKNGVKVISATENISDNPEGVILEAVLEGMAEFYSKELSQKVKRGMYESAHKCNSTGGAIPLGYKIENKKLVIDEPRAELVKKAFTMYANGTTIKQICDEFNAAGYCTAKGAKFNKNSFHNLLSNEKYVGIYKYADVRIENGIPAIISKELFDTVQKRLKRNKRAPAKNKAKVDYILSQKLFCGHCGASMVGESGTGRWGNVYHYYTCCHRKRQNSCNKKPLKKDFIERTVVEDVLKLFTPEIINELAEAAVKQAEIDAQQNTLIPTLESELKEVERSITNLIKLVEKGVESDTLTERLNELEKQKRAIEKKLVEEKEDMIVLEKEHVIWWLTHFTKGDINDEDFRKTVINLFVNSVTVWDDPDGYKITAIYNLTSHNSTTIRCSDMTPIGSPLKYYPNPVFFFGQVFGQTTKHQ